MNRRTLLKQLALATGGLALLPVGEFAQARVLAAYDELQVTASQQMLLKKLVDTLIPSTELNGEWLKGAAELDVQDFVLVMANDCLSRVDQIKFIAGMRLFDDFPSGVGRTGAGRPRFSELDRANSERALADIWGHSDPENQAVQVVQYFLNTSKWYTIQGYLNSEYVMTELMPYQLVPGPVFDGDKKIDPDAKVNIHG
ncbi:gluconate 2-dehydrogenase subunit 3 family protein [Microbulbifer bruguierae]|uniref:Gluconate 2-dehydrogenase subunit 3 family protein n=1 Tax=Microbulbifer bruguierae TaxID=3029061 RepID=A0ABY8NHI8_9GAMM|nr:gluconate 2-dehydrogenase subunit 3 family protein [Microbulbifer bruguierae]WGL18391.1 gluconate 2-dehydrogenase subunit 3 family protein [Microbulbifer bruguierae]